MPGVPPFDVLIVDDEPNIRRTLGLQLEGRGHRVRTAGSVEEAMPGERGSVGRSEAAAALQVAGEVEQGAAVHPLEPSFTWSQATTLS